MAKLKATPKNFAQALAVLGNRSSVRLGNNTYLESYVDGVSVDRIAVRLHNTDIVVFHNDGRVTLHTGGWRTITTKERINQFITGTVYQKSHEWFFVGYDANGALDWNNPVPFREGMNVGVPDKPARPELIGTRCECGAPYSAEFGGYTCAR